MIDEETPLDVRVGQFAFPGAGRPILQNISLRLRPAERVAIMGSSASGKTTLLKICAGLRGYELVSGSRSCAGRFSMLFQENVLLDYLPVGRNIALPAELNGGAADVAEISASLHIGHLLEAYPRRLSGGERKRVALARGLAYPDLVGLIMDEPFVALDLHLKESILVDFKNRLDQARLACLFSTHSAEEAVYLADRIIFLGGAPTTIAQSIPVNVSRDGGELVFQRDDFQSEVMKVAGVLRSLHLSTAL